MKKLLLGTVALAALGAGVTANAAEIAVPRRAAYVAPVMYTNWTGCHIGGDVGIVSGSDAGYTTNGATTRTEIPVPTDRLLAGGTGGTVGLVAGQPITTSFNMNGAIGGAYAGCDYQFGNWLIGAEVDWSVDNKEGQAGPATTTFTTTVGGVPPLGRDPFVSYSAKERWLATARARLGYAVDKWMFFVTGGAAWTKVDTAVFYTPAAPFASELQSDRLTGWTIGAGLEYAVGWGWSVRTEYLYVQFPSYTTLTNPVVSVRPGSSFLLNVDNGKITNNILRFGLTYKFGEWGKAPVVTK